jgi:apolipoprotein D and lipocalin family protein
MKNLIIILLTVQFLNASKLQSVPYVDAQKFSGLWYEIARTYNSFQKTCVASSVEYLWQEDKTYEVRNRCFDTKIGGDLIEYKGVAKGSLEAVNVSQLDMTYFWIFTKTYHVYYLEEDYSFALMADADLENLWIMSRTPKVDERKLQKVLTLLQGEIDLSKLIYTPHDEQGTYK